MTNTTLDQAVKEAYAAAADAAPILDTLEFSHDGLDAPLRIVHDSQDFTAKLETGVQATFIACAFDLTLPPRESAEAPPEMVVSIDNVGEHLLVPLMMAADQTSAIIMHYRSFMADRPNDGPVGAIATAWQCSRVNTNLSRVELHFIPPLASQRPFPEPVYRRAEFPGLDR